MSNFLIIFTPPHVIENNNMYVRTYVYMEIDRREKNYSDVDNICIPRKNFVFLHEIGVRCVVARHESVCLYEEDG